MTLPPSPFHFLRIHHAPIASLAFSRDNKRLNAGDQDGYVSITDLGSRRVVYYWKAHENGVLGVDEWDGHVISHGRDNSIHIYEPLPRLRGMSLAGGSKPREQGPEIWKSLPVNSLNFCRFSLVPIPSDLKGKSKASPEALLAVPNLVDSELADIYHLPSMKRFHASINHIDGKVEEGKTRSGLIMSLHLRFVATTEGGYKLMLGMGFEDGRIEIWALPSTKSAAESGWSGKGSSGGKEVKHPWARFSDGKGAVGPKLWEMVYRAKGHNEAGESCLPSHTRLKAVMAMIVDRACETAWTVSADHFLCRYPIHSSTAHANSISGEDGGVVKYSTKQIGNASIALSAEEKLLAVGGWDGSIRLFSAATGKPLGTLQYHRGTLHALAFPHPPLSPSSPLSEKPEAESSIAEDTASEVPDPTLEIGGSDSEDDEEGFGGDDKVDRWLVSGGKDTRIALWELKDFGS